MEWEISEVLFEIYQREENTNNHSMYYVCMYIDIWWRKIIVQTISLGTFEIVLKVHSIDRVLSNKLLWSFWVNNFENIYIYFKSDL